MGKEKAGLLGESYRKMDDRSVFPKQYSLYKTLVIIFRILLVPIGKAYWEKKDRKTVFYSTNYRL